MRIRVQIYVRRFSNVQDSIHTGYRFMCCVNVNFETFNELLSGIKAHTYFTPDTITVRRNSHTVITSDNFEERFKLMESLQPHHDHMGDHGALYLCAYYTSPERNAPIHTGAVCTVLDNLQTILSRLESIHCP
jgi:hypothetical protein